MAETLKNQGFCVHVYDYLDTKIDQAINFDLFIGHNKTFNEISLKLNKQCKKILLTTGSSPFYDNEMLASRQNYVQTLMGTKEKFYTPMEDIAYVPKNIEVADAFFMIGNKYISDTWNIPDHKHITHFSNVNNINFRIKQHRTNNFIYLSSVGQLRRGLDLILTVFSKRPERIYICGDYKGPLFDEFQDKIKNSPNIRLMGYVDQTSDGFQKMVDDADFAILPSCSEGQSGSVLTLMSHGLVPVITEAAGFTDFKKYSVAITDYTIQEVESAVERCVKMKEQELFEKRKYLLSLQTEHTQEKFIERFTEAINTV
ncbi:glycosyltransferase [Pseudopedobacter beijingensis]|uniref:Glycosyltransferase n=1 Tax=Pseudopedobacter beijingensis TaxID=1207056 RepID=A0ABW4I9W5_9SPHI